MEAAKADGRWDAAYESQKHATVPSDLADALAASPRAAATFEALGKTDRYAAILDVVTARSTETRAAHVRKVIAALERERPQRTRISTTTTAITSARMAIMRVSMENSCSRCVAGCSGLSEVQRMEDVCATVSRRGKRRPGPSEASET